MKRTHNSVKNFDQALESARQALAKQGLYPPPWAQNQKQMRARKEVTQPEASSVAAGDMIDALALAAIKGVYVATIYNWVKQGRLPQPRRCGRKALWLRAQVL